MRCQKARETARRKLQLALAFRRRRIRPLRVTVFAGIAIAHMLARRQVFVFMSSVRSSARKRLERTIMRPNISNRTLGIAIAALHVGGSTASCSCSVVSGARKCTCNAHARDLF